MRVKATTSFAGAVCMAVNEVRDIPAGEVLDDPLSAGFVVSAELEQPEKAVKKSEAKRNKQGAD